MLCNYLKKVIISQLNYKALPNFPTIASVRGCFDRSLCHSILNTAMAGTATGRPNTIAIMFVVTFITN